MQATRPMQLAAALAALLVTSPSAIHAGEIAKTLLNPAFWETPGPEAAELLKPFGYTWNSETHEALRTASKGNSLAGLPVIESAVWFQDNSPGKAAFLFYSRGDSGDLDRKSFEEKIGEARSALNDIIGAEPEQVDPENAAISVEGVRWNTNHGVYTLEWSYVREVRTRSIPFRAEFLRLVALPPQEELSVVERNLRTRDSALASTVVEKEATRRSNGDVVLDGIPMIDQGQKGYCVVAATERVLRFFGRDADQHELAQIANTSAKGGTSSQAMDDALELIEKRLKLRVHSEYDFDYHSFVSMVNRYNRYARRAKLPEINASGNIDMGKIYESMDGEILREARASARSDFARFASDIQRSINDGKPLLWSVMLGLLPEEGRSEQSFGGHMRLIIGYNEKEESILFSDSWGEGHEEKRMPMADAWAITTRLYSVESR